MAHKLTAFHTLCDGLVTVFFLAALCSWGLAVIAFGCELLYWLQTKGWLTIRDVWSLLDGPAALAFPWFHPPDAGLGWHAFTISLLQLPVSAALVACGFVLLGLCALCAVT
jgi:hypothetical protein